MSITNAALLIWPFVTAMLFLRLPRNSAIIWSILAGYLLLPVGVGYNLPGVPNLSKVTIPTLAVFLLCLVGFGAAARRSGPRGAQHAAEDTALRGWLPTHPIAFWLALGVILGPIATALLNMDRIRFPSGVALPGLTLYDAASGVITQATLLLPFLLGRRYLATAADQRALLVALVLAGLAYSLPTLFEVRFSPQLHTWVYGYFPHSWRQHVRFEGFRPLVFVEHGLRLAIFMAMCFAAAAVFWRAEAGKPRLRALFAAIWLGGTLALCNSVGALMIAVAFAPVLFLAGRSTQLAFAAAIALTVVLFPMLRSAGLVPLDGVRAVVMEVSPTKIGSINHRFFNEDQLLARALERPVFGWGSWGRGRVYDPETGEDISTPDGIWVILIGQFGWVGYLGRFGLLALPVVLLFLRRREAAVTPESVGLCLVLTVNMVDMLPNSSLTPISWLLAGALTGRAEQLASSPAARLRAAASARPAPSRPGRRAGEVRAKTQ